MGTVKAVPHQVSYCDEDWEELDEGPLMLLRGDYSVSYGCVVIPWMFPGYLRVERITD